MIALFYIGCLISIVAGIWFLVVAFKTSILWGLGCLIVPFVSLIFLFMHWEAAKKPFLWSLLGFVMIIVPVLMHPEWMSGLR
jgi:hypothetical protein